MKILFFTLSILAFFLPLSAMDKSKEKALTKHMKIPIQHRAPKLQQAASPTASTAQQNQPTARPPLSLNKLVWKKFSENHGKNLPQEKMLKIAANQHNFLTAFGRLLKVEFERNRSNQELNQEVVNLINSIPKDCIPLRPLILRTYIQLTKNNNKAKSVMTNEQLLFLSSNDCTAPAIPPIPAFDFNDQEDPLPDLFPSLND